MTLALYLVVWIVLHPVVLWVLAWRPVFDACRWMWWMLDEEPVGHAGGQG